MPIFKIMKFSDANGNSDLIDWYDKLDMEGKAIFEAMTVHLCACPSHKWSYPYCKNIGDGIYEIRFKCKRVQQRPLGYFGPNNNEFTFIFPAKEKDRKFIPKDAVERAKERRQLVKINPKMSTEWIFELKEDK